MKGALPDPWVMFQRGWRSLTSQFGMLIVAWLVFIAIALGASGVTTVAIQFGLQIRGALVIQLLGNAVNGLLGIGYMFLYAGLMKIHLNAARGERIQIATLFGQGRLLGTYLLTNSLVQVVVFLLYIPVVVIAGPPTAYLVSQGAIGPGVVVGGAFLLLSLILILPVIVATLNAMLFVVDAEQDPIAAVMSGFHSIRGQGWWCVRFGLWALAFYTAFVVIVIFTCGLGAVLLLLLAPFALQVGCHTYLALAEQTEASLRKAPAPAPAPAPSHPSDLLDAPGALVPTYQRSTRDAGPPDARPEFLTEVAPRRVELVVPAGATFFRPRPVHAWAVPLAILLFVPWFVAGGNPIGSGMAGWWVARRLGFPQWIGVSTGVGALLLCGVAAMVLLTLAFRGRRAAVMDQDGVCLDVTPFWQGVRLSWLDLAGFRIGSGGVQLYVRSGWLRWIWKPVLPCVDREAHDVVTVLESHHVYRIE